ncbi:MAG: CapA family protein [Clostridia bacterium]|nr:CapA family protein [Clostridia bacterium]
MTKKKKNKKLLRRKKILRNIQFILFGIIALVIVLLIFTISRTSGDYLNMPTATPILTPTPTSTPTSTPTPTPTPTLVPTPTPTPLSEIAQKSLENREDAILISAIGDCTLGGIYQESNAEKFKEYADENGLDYFFENVRDIFFYDDLTIANLEVVLIEKGKPRKNRPFIMQGYPEYINILTTGGVDAVNIANNHTKDFEEEGIASNHALLEEAGIAYCGFGPEAVVEVKGKKIGLLGYTVWESEIEDNTKDIQRMKETCDLVIVSMHGGDEKAYKPTKDMVKYCRAAADAGADLVLGHHTHVVNGIENYNGATIVYSLANFCFGGNKNPDDKDTFIFQQEFIIGDDGMLTHGDINIIPCSISSVENTNDLRPTVLEGEDAERVFKKIAKYSVGMENPYTYDE